MPNWEGSRRIPDIPAYGEGKSEVEAIADPKQRLLAYIEAFGVEGALWRADPPTARRYLDLGLDS
jgi:hypothetical protein